MRLKGHGMEVYMNLLTAFLLIYFGYTFYYVRYTKMKKRLDHIILGCVADDFTGASDAASFLAKKGIKTLLFNGIPKEEKELGDCAAIVIAMKTRSIPAKEAADDTLHAIEWLKEQGVERYYIKYCSTFDSTPKGNIGPDIDAVLEKYNIPYTFLCPSLPVNKRIVKNGVLIVDGKPIAEGHMANHPLNPMWASELSELMREQGKYSCLILNEQDMSKSAEEIRNTVEEYAKEHEHFYIVPEYASDEDGKKIADVFGHEKLLTGGSGLLEFLAADIAEAYDCYDADTSGKHVKGRGIALSGSCSTATCEQCKTYSKENPAIAVYPEKLLIGEQTVEKIWEEISKNPDKEYLVYSAGATDPESRHYDSEERAEKASQKLEETMAAIGKLAYDAGYTRIICAGGETSGAIALALGFDGFIIGESIAPGVPILTPLHNQNIRLALKSGNFGQTDFFRRALDMTKEQ